MGRAVAQARAGLSSRTGWSAAALLPLAFLALFFAWPVLAIVSLGLREGGVLSALADSDTWELVGFTLGQALAFVAVQQGVFGLYMGVSFAPNHKGMPMERPEDNWDYLRRQVITSRNIRGNPVVDLVLGGLNYQIEHHLFPSMPRPHLRRAAPLIAQYCHDHDVPYTQTSLVQSYGIVLRYINRVGLDGIDAPAFLPALAIANLAVTHLACWRQIRHL